MGAQNISFLLSQVRTATSALVGGKVYFYSAGTSNLKNIWLDSAKGALAANPYTLDANATAKLYGDGAYRVVIKTSAGVTKYDWDDVVFNDFTDSDNGADLVGYNGGTVADALDELSINYWYNVKDKKYGALGDGETDDTDAIIDALYDVVENGGILFFPAGTYNISSAISLSGFTGTKKAFWILGSGKNATILNRLNNCGTVLNLRNAPDGVKISDLTVNVNSSTAHDNANHTIVVGEASDVLVEHIIVNDPYKSGVMILSEVAVGGQPIYNCLINNVVVNGVIGGSSIGIDVGLLIAGTNVVYSGITNCRVYNVGTNLALSPGIGIELKYAGEGCYVDNCFVYNALQGFGNPDDTASAINERTRITNCHAKGCVTALSGKLNNCIVDNFVIDMSNDTNLLEPIQINGSGGSYTGIIIKNLANTAKYHVRFIGTASNNYVEISQIENSNSAKAIASFESGCVGNTVDVKRMALPAVTSLTTAGLVLDSNTDQTLNIVRIDGLPPVYAKTIASGAIAVNRMAQTVILETESAAASDDLATISGGVEGQILNLRTTADARDVVIKHGTDNILLVGAADYTLDKSSDSITLQYHGNTSKWCEVSRANVA